MADGISFDHIRTGSNYNLISLYEEHDSDDIEQDSPFQYNISTCDYHEPDQFRINYEDFLTHMSFFHLNCRGLASNWESFHELLCDLHSDKFAFDCIGISELFNCSEDMRINIPGFHKLIARNRDDGPRGGVGIFIKEHLNYVIREDISVFIPHVFESIFVEITMSPKHTVVGVIYRPNSEPRADVDIFSSTLFDIMEVLNTENKHCVIMGDMNIDLLKFGSHSKTSDYLDNIFTYGYLPVITKPTRVTNSSASLIDHIYINDIASTGHSGIIVTEVADHFGTFYLRIGKKKCLQNPSEKIRIFSETNKNKFKTCLGKINFQPIQNIMCPNEAYNEFLSLYKNAFENSFPLRNKTVKSKFVKREPWFSKGLLVSSVKRRKLYYKKLNKPNDSNITAFKNYNNIFNKLKRAMKITYFKISLEENKFNVKKTWAILRQAIGKLNDKSNYPNTFMINDIPVTDKLLAV